MTFLLPFSILFLDRFLKLVYFLAQLCERLLCGIEFSCAFLGCSEVGFFVSILLVPTTILCVVLGMCAPMFLSQVAVFLGMSFLRNPVSRLHVRSLLSFFVFHRSFLGGL